MWEEIIDGFDSEPAKLRVVEFILRRGYSVDEELGIHSDGLKISHRDVARELNVDRRTVSKTVDSILEDEELRDVFKNLSSIPFLEKAAPVLDLHVITVYVDDAAETGLLANISEVFDENDVLIRQAIVEDPYFSNQPTFIAIVDELDESLIKELSNLDFVESVNSQS